MRFTGLSLSNDISKLTSLGPTKSRKPSTRIWVYNSEIKRYRESMRSGKFESFVTNRLKGSRATRKLLMPMTFARGLGHVRGEEPGTPALLQARRYVNGKSKDSDPHVETTCGAPGKARGKQIPRSGSTLRRGESSSCR
jgi:hypothetical protein